MGISFITQKNKSVDILKKFVPKGSNVLDIGCGNGQFAEHASRSGYKVTGCDIENSLTKENIDFFKIDISYDNIHKPKQFEAVTMWSVLEHLENPFHAVREVRDSLTDGGWFLFSIPNIFTLKDKIFFFLRGDFLKYRSQNEHIAIFTKSVLRKLLSDFDIVKICYFRGGRNEFFGKIMWVAARKKQGG